MFEEIPSSPKPLSRKGTITGFGALGAIFLAGLIGDRILWSGPMSLNRKVITGEEVVGAVLCLAFLLTEKFTTPENNRRRLWAVIFVSFLVQLFIDVHQ